MKMRGTTTGEEIFFEGWGFALTYGEGGDDAWSYTATLRFEEPEPPYEWLARAPAVWVGTLEPKQERARYRVYFPTRERR